jgi:hypothetical protein
MLKATLALSLLLSIPAFAQVPPDIFIEAEAATEHTFNEAASFPGIVSGDQILRLWKDPDPGPDGYWAKLPFSTETAAIYHVWLAASITSVSPFWWRIDNGEWKHFDADTDTDIGSAFGVSNCMAWVRLTDTKLQPGPHVLWVKVNERRTILEHAYLLYLDAALITARDVAPDGLVRPTDLPNLKPYGRTAIVPVQRAGKPGPPMILGSSVGSARQNHVLASLGFKLLQTDSDHLTVNETEPGKWDWQSADAGLADAQKVGARWQYFPHFHWTTDWLMKTDRFVPSVGLNTGRRLRCMSIWSPYLPEWFDHCYAAMAQHYGSGVDNVAAIYLGIHGDFGEVLFPMGYHPDERTRFGEAGTGTADWWCGDDYARAAFRKLAQDKYGTVTKLNAAWGTSYASFDQVAYPPIPSIPPESMPVTDRRHWLDFINWYHDSMTDYMRMVARTARKHFPKSRLVVPVGNGDESLVGGCDLTAIVKACRESGCDMRSTHGGFQPPARNLSTMLRRLASASHFYGVPFWSEPPGGITPEGEVGRFFESITCRATGYWDWGNNPVGATKVFRKYGGFLTHENTVCDVALMYPNTDQRFRPQVGYPPLLDALGTQLRSVTDFDIVDERMVRDGALSGYRVLVFTDGVFFPPDVLAKIEAWVKAGGVMVRGYAPMMTVEGDTSVWQRLSGGGEALTAPAEATVADRAFLRYTAQSAALGQVPGVPGLTREARVLATSAGKPAIWARPLGKGLCIICAGGPVNQALYRSVVRDAIYNLPKLDPTKPAARELAPDAAWGTLYTTLLASGEVIAYNDGDKPVQARITGHEVELAPHSLLSLK